MAKAISLSHVFCLFLLNDGGVYRMKSYGRTIYSLANGLAISSTGKMSKKKESLYCSRIVEWSTYKSDLTTLNTAAPIWQSHLGPGRIDYWNGLFSAVEKEDSDISPMDVELHLIPDNLQET
jgi:hypothetical protein